MGLRGSPRRARSQFSRRASRCREAHSTTSPKALGSPGEGQEALPFGWKAF